jgi:hypothetical protein
MPSGADVLYPGKQNVADNGEIIAGEQKMSLKCPVSPPGIALEGWNLTSANS